MLQDEHSNQLATCPKFAKQKWQHTMNEAHAHKAVKIYQNVLFPMKLS